MRSPKNPIGYLQGFFDGEGNAQCDLRPRRDRGGRGKGHRVVSIASTSPELIELVSILLRNLVFTPRIYPLKRQPGWSQSWALYLTGRRDLIRFARLIGFRKEDNAARLREIRRSYWRSNRRYRFYGLAPRILQMRREGISLREIARRVGAPSKSTIQALLRREVVERTGMPIREVGLSDPPV